MRIKIKKRIKKESSGWQRTSKYWVAMGTLAAYSAAGTKMAAVALAQSPARVPAPTQGTLPTVRFDIPAGPLDAVVAEFQRVAGLQILIPNEAVRQIQSPGVSGTFTPEQGLQKILAGTGVDYKFGPSDTVTLSLQPVATTIDVTDSLAALTASTPKFTESLLDTPQSISVVSQQVMAAQGVTTLRDALRNVAGISLAAGEGGAQGDNLTIRGFTARNDLFIDGMRDFGSYYRDPFNMQEVEVLQGPSSVTFGRGSTGGVVNQATKGPVMDSFINGTAQFGTDATRRATVDINKPLSFLGTGAAFRMNLMGNIGGVAGRPVAENRRYGIAPSLSLGLGTATRATFSYFHQAADDIPDYGIPWLFNQPAPVSRTNYYGFRNGNYLRTNADIGTARLEHDVNSHIVMRVQSRYANYTRDARITEPQILTPALTTPLSALLVNRNEITVNSVETYFDNQFDITAKFETGFLRHTLVAGVEAGRETSSPIRPRYTGVPTASLLNPNPNDVFAGVATISSSVKTVADSQGAYALDTIRLGSKWELSGGLRWDRLGANYQQYIAPATAFTRVDNMPTWRGAIVYKPVQIGSIYFDAGTSFNPSAESLSLAANTANLPPEKNRTYEFGTKWDLSGGRLSLRGALFRTEKMNAREPDPANSLLNVLAGNQKVDGVQFEMRGRITSRWNMLASYAHLDARVVGSKFYPSSIGARLANVPANTFNFWSEYRLPQHWEIGAGGNFVSSRTSSSTAPLDPTTGLVKQAPGYWVFNAMAKRPINDHINFQVNVNNVANRYYYDLLHPAHVIIGPGRSAMAGFTFKF